MLDIKNDMKTKPTLEDYLHTARNDSPALSFEEAARRVREADRRKRRGFWLWLRSSLAAPLIGWNVSGRIFWSGALAGAAAVGLVLMMLPRGANINNEMPSQTASRAALRATSPVLAETPVVPPHTNASTFQHRIKPSSLLAFTTPQRRDGEGASANTPPYSMQPAGKSDAAYTTNISVMADSNAASAADIPTTSTQAAPPLLAWMWRVERDSTPVAKVPSILSIANNKSASASSTLSSTLSNTSSRALAVSDTTQASPALLFTPKSRFSVEYRVAARTGFDATSGGTPFQNMALGVFYRLSEHHSIGLEGGTQPFALGYRAAAPTFSTLTTFPSMDTNTTRTAGIQLSNPNTPTGTNTKQEMPAEAQSGILPWVAGAYQYSHDVTEFLGVGVQPLARASLGGGAAGGLGRFMAGVQFLPEGSFTFLLAAEAAVLGRTTTDQTLANRFLLSSQTGITMGVSVKF
jgi:hypothetical protein